MTADDRDSWVVTVTDHGVDVWLGEDVSRERRERVARWIVAGLLGIDAPTPVRPDIVTRLGDDR